MGEDDQTAVSSRFFKIMLPGFEEKLKLPPAFCDKVKHEKSKRTILESCKGKWEMKVFREDDDDDDQIVLKDGWSRFAHAHGLTIGDFILFEHTAKLHFNVVVCGTGCEKLFFANDPIPDNKQPKGEAPLHKQEHAPVDNQSSCFSVNITNYSAFDKKARVTIPKNFIRSNDLEQKICKEKTKAILKDPQGREWKVKVTSQKRTVIASGWHKFAAANDLKFGDLCTFHLKPTKSPTSKIIYFHVSIRV